MNSMNQPTEQQLAALASPLTEDPWKPRTYRAPLSEYAGLELPVTEWKHLAYLLFQVDEQDNVVARHFLEYLREIGINPEV